jgi:hypothetical protein
VRVANFSKTEVVARPVASRSQETLLTPAHSKLETDSAARQAFGTFLVWLSSISGKAAD